MRGRARTIRAAIVMTLGVALILALAPASAPAFVYWAELGGFGEGEIGRARLDGSHVDRKFVRGAIGPVAVTTDRRHIYWINGDGDSIGRARLDGSRKEQRFIDGVGFAEDLDVAGGKIYWTRGSTLDADATIARADRDGTNVEHEFIPFTDPDFTTPHEIAVGGGRIYWGNAYPIASIARANLDGTGVEQAFITAGVKRPWGLALADEHLYWANAGTKSIARASLDGAAVELEFIDDLWHYVSTVAVDDRHIYWNQPRGRIGRARLGGTNLRRGFIDRSGGRIDSVFVDGRGPG